MDFCAIDFCEPRKWGRLQKGKPSPVEEGDGEAAGHGYQPHLLNATKRPNPAAAKPSPDPISSARTRRWAAEVTVQVGEELLFPQKPFYRTRRSRGMESLSSELIPHQESIYYSIINRTRFLTIPVQGRLRRCIILSFPGKRDLFVGSYIFA